jgi:hypothetical protein
MNDFNPNDHNAILQRLLSHAETIQEDVKEIKTGQNSLGLRVSELEQEKWYNRGVVAAIGIMAAGAWEWWRTRF